MGKQHIIELNGKRYDAITGKTVGIDPIPAESQKKLHALKRIGARGKHNSVDGFSGNTHGLRPKSLNHIPSHKTEKSKTLMRGVVKKPYSAKPSSLVRRALQPSASVVSAHTPAKPAASIQKSSLIRRFSDMAASLPSSPAFARAETKIPQTTRVQAVATTTAAAANPIDRGLASADSHKQLRQKRPRLAARAAKRLRIRPRTLSAASFAVAALLIGGFFVFQNMPRLSMRLASARAGLQGSLPAYQPGGFSLKGGVSYRPGQIVLDYASNSDNRNFKITQTASSWNSETLAQNYEPLKSNSNYQTIPNNGKTIYVYNGSNATWVDGGVWYRIEGDSKLGSDQLLNVADSL